MKISRNLPEEREDERIDPEESDEVQGEPTVPDPESKELLQLQESGLSAGTRTLCIFGHLGLVSIWSCFVSCLLLPLYYVVCAPVLTEGAQESDEEDLQQLVQVR